MTRDEFLTVLLIERFGPDAARSRPPIVPSPETRQWSSTTCPDSRPTVIVRAARP